jgi:hypothetical protein
MCQKPPGSRGPRYTTGCGSWRPKRQSLREDSENHPDRDEQFGHINQTAETFIEMGQPVISVDAKKKELVGNFKNNGREYRPSGSPEQVEVYDFIRADFHPEWNYGIRPRV